MSSTAWDQEGAEAANAAVLLREDWQHALRRHEIPKMFGCRDRACAGIGAGGLVDHGQRFRHPDPGALENARAQPFVFGGRLPRHIAANAGDRPVQGVGDESRLVLRGVAALVVDAVLDVFRQGQLAGAAAQAKEFPHQLHGTPSALLLGVAQIIDDRRFGLVIGGLIACDGMLDIGGGPRLSAALGERYGVVRLRRIDVRANGQIRSWPGTVLRLAMYRGIRIRQECRTFLRLDAHRSVLSRSARLDWLI